MVFLYDGSYEGLLSCIFAIFKERAAPVDICHESRFQHSLLDTLVPVVTQEEWATRVLKGIDDKTEARASSLIYKLFLSELPNSEMLVYQVISAIMRKGNASALENFAEPCILKASQVEKMMDREIHRMHAFVRFQKNQSGVFYAAIEPDFNVLPLIGDHFERRYADQPWLIFDTRRHYGLYYDQATMSFVMANNPVVSGTAAVQGGFITDDFLGGLADDKEHEYQTLWKNYFHAVNIRERNNTKLHLRHMPRRYWKYLTEKKSVNIK